MTLRHDALLYGSDAEFVDWLGDFARDGIDLGEDLFVVASPTGAELLRQALGEMAALLTFFESAQWYRRPADTIARFKTVIDEARASGARGVRVVGEVEFGETGIDNARWTRYEAIVNTAFAAGSTWIVCPYDTRRLPGGVVDNATRTHPNLVKSGRRIGSAVFDPTSFLTPLPLSVEGEMLGEIEVDSALRPLRQFVTRTAREAGLKDERVAEMCLVVNEVATNAIVHGEPPVRLRAWSDEDSVVYEVTDSGPGPDDPLAGFIPPGQDAVDGRGLWVARRLADRLEIANSGKGTSVKVASHRR